ncbi:hypothetical protein [Escherichia coli]|uniref:hypothetical protein n=2 Tax=Escherichia coli TaxID=562 RepID=UPI0002CCBE12|nr:hypothetical protein [Escherichia coli]EMU83431.1 putative lipoprotein [Escherichia coli MP021017.6]EMU85700.1 putative lipoprotein [Escherichia coli MP021017.5]EMU96258.1 putative lipoprotein [Escherichia coli MP021017.4]
MQKLLLVVISFILAGCANENNVLKTVCIKNDSSIQHNIIEYNNGEYITYDRMKMKKYNAFKADEYSVFSYQSSNGEKVVFVVHDNGNMYYRHYPSNAVQSTDYDEMGGCKI